MADLTVPDLADVPPSRGPDPVRSSRLAEALAAFQAELPTVVARETGKVSGQNKEGKAFSYEYSYADLAAVSQAALPLLGKHGLAFTAWPTLNQAGQFVLRYELLHKAGEVKAGEYPIRAGNPQATGSEITYARRYCLCAVTGISPDQDDDAAAATQAKQTEFPTSPSELDTAKQRVYAAWTFQYGAFVQDEVAKDYAAWSAGGVLTSAGPAELRNYAAYLATLSTADAGSEPAEAQHRSDKPEPDMSPRQRGKLFALMGEIGLHDKADQLRWINQQLSTEYESRSQITYGNAKILIDGLQKGIDAPAGSPSGSSEPAD